MDNPTLGADAFFDLDPTAVLSDVGVPMTADAVVATTVEQWRVIVMAILTMSFAWPDDYAATAEKAADGSVEIDSGIGFFSAVAALTALGAEAIPSEFMKRDRLTSVDKVADLVYESAQRFGSTA